MKDAFVIFPGEAAWRVATVADGAVIDKQVLDTEHASADQIARQVHSTLEELGYAGQGVALALPSSWCLAATITTEARSRARSNPQRLAYQLEEQLPLAAEEYVADFLRSGRRPGQALGVAVPLWRIADLIDALEGSGVAVDLISPAALLAYDGTGGHQAGKASEVICWQTNAHVDVLTIIEGRLSHWSVVPNRSGDLEVERRLRYLQSGGEFELKSVNQPEVRDSLPPEGQTTESLETYATRAGCAVLKGTLQPSINLRQGQLQIRDPFRQIRRPLVAAFASLALLLVGLCGALLYRATLYQQGAEQAEREQVAIFTSAMPGKAIPIDATLLLETELRRLKGLSGMDSPLPFQRSALSLLQAGLTALPKELRFRVLELKVDSARLQVEGQARSHKDAEMIATSLRSSGVFEPEAPRTEQLSDGNGVSYSLSAAIHTGAEGGKSHP